MMQVRVGLSFLGFWGFGSLGLKDFETVHAFINLEAASCQDRGPCSNTIDRRTRKNPLLPQNLDPKAQEAPVHPSPKTSLNMPDFLGFGFRA